MTKSLVEQIQRDALDEEVSVSSLLRKVKFAAAKLQLPTVEAWVDDELKGYQCDGDKLPKYRQTRGTIKIWNPYHGWQPVGGDAEMLTTFSQVYMWDPIAAFENIPQKAKGGTATYPFNPTKLEILSKATNSDIARAGVDIPHGALFAVLDVVRTLVLEWAIELEKAGVIGEGMSFSNEDKKIAKASESVTMHIGSIGTFTGNLGVGNASGDISSSQIDVEQVKNLVSQIKSRSRDLVAEGVNAADLTAALKVIEQNITAKTPGPLRQGLGELQKVVAKATGGLIAHGVLALLHQIVGTGVPT